MSLDRRSLLQNAVIAATASRIPHAAGQSITSTTLPEQGEYLLRGGYVLTMDPLIGDVANGDVHIRNGEIVAVGQMLSAPGATLINATDFLVLPGFVETHWHIWTTMLRSMSGDISEHGYFPTSRGIGSHYLASDMYASSRLALAEAVNSGITFVHDWCHNIGEPEFARQALQALADSGVRGRFSYGTPTVHPGEEPVDREDLAVLARSWDSYNAGGRLHLGLAWRGLSSEASLEDARFARELGLPLSVHVNNFQRTAGGIQALADRGVLDSDVQLIHAIWSSEEEIAAVAKSGASLSLSPFTEMRIGFGFPMTGEYLDAGVPIGLSVDTPALSGNADMFAIMKVIQNVANARDLDEYRLSARRILELATIEGARSMGIADVAGSLTVGKRADLQMIDTRHVNIGVVAEPTHILVEAAQPANVDTVFIDGRILKQGGRLTAVDTTSVIQEARDASIGARERADWW